MTLELPPYHLDLTWITPLSEARAERLVSFVAEPGPATVLDLGCGWGELLMRVLAAVPGARAIGVDVAADRIDHGRSLAEGRGLGDRVDLVVGDAARLAVPVDAVLCIGASQAWGPPVEDGQPLDYAAALTALRRLLPRGGRLVYGEAIWSAPPTPAAVAPLAGRDDELSALPDLVELAVDHGFAVVQIHEAAQAEWDEFASGLVAGGVPLGLPRRPRDGLPVPGRGLRNRRGVGSVGTTMTNTPERIVYTARASVTGGRAGQATSEDGILDLDLTAPKETGGPGAGTNPEQLFAVGPEGDSFAITADITATIPSVDDATAQELVEAAHRICPYSEATRGSVPVTVTGKGA